MICNGFCTRVLHLCILAMWCDSWGENSARVIRKEEWGSEEWGSDMEWGEEWGSDMFHTSYTYKIYTATSQTGLIILTLSLSFLFCSGRLSAAQCLKHPWLNNISEKAKGNNIILKSQVLLRKYMARRLWKVKKKNSTFIHIKQYAIRNNLSMCSLSLSLLSCRKTILL